MNFSITDEIKKFPFIRISLPFILGIILAVIIEVPSLLSFIIFLICLFLFIAVSLRKKFSSQFLTGILINVALFFFGLFITQYRIDNSKSVKLLPDSGLIIGEISKDVKKSTKSVSFNLDIQAINHNNEWFSSSGKTLLYLEKDTSSQNLKVGDVIVFSPTLSEIKNSENPEEFDYKRYLSYNLIYNSDYLTGSDWHLLESEQNIKLKYKILRFRSKLINTLKNLGLDDDELAVVSALALGYKDNLSNEIRHNYSSSGAMHILAVSGLHVGIIYGMLLFFLSFIKVKKFEIPKVIIIILFIWFYAVLTGLSPSVTRASLMFTIAAIGSLQKHRSGTLNTIALSAFILLLINPLNIVDIGFQLSYLAVIGIVTIQPLIYNIFSIKNKILNWLWSLTTVSLAAQIATAPLCIYYFNQFSNYFLLTNYILIPVSTIAIWLCIITFAFSGINVLGLFFTKLLSYVVKFMNFSVESIESLPFSVSENLYINIAQSLLLYILIIFIFIFFFASKRYKHLVIAICSLILFSGIGLYNAINTSKQKYIIVYNINQVTAINIIDGRDNILFANLDLIDHEKIRFNAKNNWLKKGLDKEKYIDLSSDKRTILSNLTTIDNKRIFFKKKFIAFENYSIFVLDNNFDQSGSAVQKIDTDFIVLSNNPNIKLSKINELFNFKTIIFDSSNNNYITSKWLEENNVTRYEIHNVNTDGAFVFSLPDKK